MTVENLEPEDVARRLAEGSVLLVDVREANEFALERIEGALLVPLSTFDPQALPDPEGRKMVFQCRSGARSTTAAVRCLDAGLACGSHMRGGILAWKAAGLPTLAGEPA
ncbi:MAG TPA: rhodanese-like domain-containing protein [Rhizomicrobium sp.]|jgi:rhodanese-related sulfurtransferase|nr:rhodanese-like domain-containing protein [Rhizomicrobium sp.]